MARYDGVLFDLLSGLIDSWSLWNEIAGGERAGREWRHKYLELTYEAGSYQPYDELVEAAARKTSVPDTAADRLFTEWTNLEPWPEAPAVLESIRDRGVKRGVVTNCTEEHGRAAAELLGVAFDTVATAERAGWYKPNPEPYELAIEELDCTVDRILFVSGSGRDVPGARAVGLSAVWHNRVGLPTPDGVTNLPTIPTLDPLPTIIERGVEAVR